MTYQQARQVLDRFPRFEVKPGLTRVRQLLALLGQPQFAHPTIHVGGTNGKGSVVAMLDAVLRDAGFRVGRFTSPELIDFRDRIVVNGECISEVELAAAVERMAPMIEALDEVPSQFEIITALAFDHLARSGVDVSVIEVGLGGRFDATNVISPELAILTNVTLDHQAILGDTVEKIAWEKAGIAKSERSFIVGRLPNSVLAIVRAECEAVGAHLVSADGISVERVSRDWDAAVYEVNGCGGIRTLRLPLIGLAQRDNLTLVLAAILQLRARGFGIPDEAVVEGLKSVCWPGRMEVIRKKPTIVLDGAHNPAAIQALASDVVDLVPDAGRRFLLYGTLADKDADTSLEILSAIFPSVGICASQSPRSLPISQLAETAGRYFRQITQYHSVAEGVESWLAQATPDDVLVVTGSLTVVGEARHWVMGER